MELSSSALYEQKNVRIDLRNFLLTDKYGVAHKVIKDKGTFGVKELYLVSRSEDRHRFLGMFIGKTGDWLIASFDIVDNIPVDIELEEYSGPSVNAKTLFERAFMFAEESALSRISYINLSSDEKDKIRNNHRYSLFFQRSLSFASGSRKNLQNAINSEGLPLELLSFLERIGSLKVFYKPLKKAS